jgi:hypothetical protein
LMKSLILPAGRSKSNVFDHSMKTAVARINCEVACYQSYAYSAWCLCVL